MAKLYLLGSSVEPNEARERARLQGINNETYVYYCNTLGNPHYPSCETMYCFQLKEKMEVADDGEGNPVLDEDGNNTYIGTGDFCLEIDTEQPEYACMPSVHVSRLVSRSTMESIGWFANE